MNRTNVLGLVAALAACGRISFDEAADDAPVDASLDAPFATGMFTTVRMVPELDIGSDQADPSLTRDLLEIYFVANKLGSWDLWSATRAAADQPWSTPAPMAALNTMNPEHTPGVSSDGLTLWFTSSRGAGYEIYVTTRTTRAEPWNPPVAVAELNAAGVVEDFGFEVDAAGTRAVLYRNSPGASRTFETHRFTETSPWDAPVDRAELNTAGQDRSPMLATDLHVVFVSDRNAGNSLDVFLATRDTPDSSFTTITPISELNTAEEEDDPWLSSDGHTLWFQGMRSGTRRLFEATR